MDSGTEIRSKSQAKREMLALQSLGEKLFNLSEDQITKIEMPQELREALLFAKTIRKGEARRRQLQYVGALMREVDPEPIRKALDDIQRGYDRDVDRFREVERWRDELVAGNDAILDEIVNRFPGADRRNLLLLIRKARTENRTPKASRALFRFLKELHEA